MTRPQELRRIGVFCGSSPGARPAYAQAAVALGEALLRRGLGLVYGGGCVGLMGIVADAVLAGGGEVIGVIPRSLARKEVAHQGISELLVVEDMFERKRIMMDRADAFVSLPGGVGTLDELFEVWTWVQLGHISKPLGLLDVEDFYDGLCRFLDQLVNERFLRSPQRELLLRDGDPDALLHQLAAWIPSDPDKRIDRS